MAKLVELHSHFELPKAITQSSLNELRSVGAKIANILISQLKKLLRFGNFHKTRRESETTDIQSSIVANRPLNC